MRMCASSRLLNVISTTITKEGWLEEGKRRKRRKSRQKKEKERVLTSKKLIAHAADAGGLEALVAAVFIFTSWAIKIAVRHSSQRNAQVIAFALKFIGTTFGGYL